MLSAGLHLSFSHLNMSVRWLEMVIFEGGLLFFVAPEGFMDDFLFFIIFAHLGETCLSAALCVGSPAPRVTCAFVVLA